ncbi:hypothetical protein HW423_07660 [Aerococcaceae bacterium INB8]|uniref:HpcH/HpaI aldolase/citrate lyase domain-containing protein n=1 Tax=Ruoffia halotolerans TaxID=2748684 RepID=A0A839A634_9LACT|nr:hypothetical protein [Ruoffia halotolerans]
MIDGVDGIFVGLFDFTIALGIPAQFDHHIFKEALAHIYKACRDNNRFTFIFGANTEQTKNYRDYSFDAVTCSMDATIMIEAFKNMLETVKK